MLFRSGDEHSFPTRRSSDLVERRRHIFEATEGDGRVDRREFGTERRWITSGEMLKVAAGAGLAVERATAGYGDIPAHPGAEQILYTLRRAT